ncbi:MAG TPA: polyprenyl synthetase family protein [Phycisphaerae bacterium]|nr:polyprenyl synthetase family protein [Phycisphaerae bacterium]
MNAVIEKPTLDLAAPVAAALDQVMNTFDEELCGDLPFVEKLVDQVRQFRGKLLRPKLLLLTAKAVGDIRREHIVLAAVVEMVHMATLVHDDVLDESDVRRRRPTINRLVGNEGAVLLGDYLISHAYHLCTSLGSVEYARRIADVTNTVCEGELMQIEHRGDTDLSEARYLEIIRRKTAALTGVCCELGAAAAGADRRIVQSMAAFGVDLGMAFQIVDDLLDLTGTENELGKTAGRDADLGKWTLPAIRFRDRADAADRRRLVDALSNGSPDKSESIRSILAGSDAMDYAMGMARSYVQSALRQLAELPMTDAKKSLIAAAEFIVNRRA